MHSASKIYKRLTSIEELEAEQQSILEEERLTAYGK
jgi:hypothetical protein